MICSFKELWSSLSPHLGTTLQFQQQTILTSIYLDNLFQAHLVSLLEFHYPNVAYSYVHFAWSCWGRRSFQLRYHWVKIWFQTQPMISPFTIKENIHQLQHVIGWIYLEFMHDTIVLEWCTEPSTHMARAYPSLCFIVSQTMVDPFMDCRIEGGKISFNPIN